MKVGLLFSQQNPEQFKIPWPRKYAETLEEVILGEQLGFDGVFTTEHHFADDGYGPSPMATLASWATATDRISVGTLIATLPLHNPLRLAEDAAIVDIISNGRLILGLGLGYRVEEYRGFGIDRAQRGERANEALEVVVRALTDRRFSYDGKYFHYSDVHLSPGPVQTPRPPIWCSALSFAGAERVARHGLEGFAGPALGPFYDHYLAKCGEFGTTPTAESQVTLFGHLHEDDEVAWREAEPYATYFHTTYNEWLRTSGEHIAFPGTVREDLVIGGVDHWLSRIAMCLDGGGMYGLSDGQPARPTYLNLQLQLPGMPHAMVERSLRLFARAVLPQIR